MIQNHPSGRTALLAGALVLPAAASAATMTMEPLVVTTSAMDTPHEITSDPRRPQITLPATDGGAWLESTTGFNVSRKGGTSGEPVLRGLGGSRLNIGADGGAIPGGCPSRMDPPTAYIFPQSYDRIEITKGPQSVRHGPASAGSVRFERESPTFQTPGTNGFTSFTAGSHARNDLVTEVTSGNRQGYARFIGTLSAQDDYDDGDGEPVHSEYERWSSSAIAGWTPGNDTEVELAYDRSNGQAAYDDRMMDGTEFDRTSYRLGASRDNLASWLPGIEASFYYNRIDHVMDNFRLRTPSGMTMVRLVARRTLGGRLAADLAPVTGTEFHAGVDFSRSEHGDSGPVRGAQSPAPTPNIQDLKAPDTAEFTNVGVFADMEHTLGTQSLVTLGLRGDYHEAEVLADRFSTASRGNTDHRSQWSGFARFEKAMAEHPLHLYAGLGRSERAPDFWERNRDFSIGNETLTQLDAGLTWDSPRVEATVAAFHGWYDDYILITDGGDRARNITAITKGMEADLSYTLSPLLTLNASLAYTRGTNDSENTPLAQMPPLEGTLSLDYQKAGYSAGLLWRGVARQDRIDPGSGTIYSLDTQETPGFGTLSLHAGLPVLHQSRLSLGIDNLFDRRYAEHIQQGSADLGASAQPINEPGRMLWATLTTEF
ncbi:TonB-dependent copper receptor [Halomonadaceae bacterium KBTZ08]